MREGRQAEVKAASAPPQQDSDPGSTAPGMGRSSSNSLEPGVLFADRYAVQELLGAGATGQVYAARRQPDGLAVAVKVIHPELAGNRQVVQRFHREARILSGLKGAHIVTAYEYGEDARGRLYLAMELVPGQPLDAVLREQPLLPLDAVTDIAVGICRALLEAHGSGVIHRDLKPGNVMVQMRGRRVIGVRVLDFGLSKVLQGELGPTNLTEQNMVLGTPEYMAPEQARGDEIDERVDLYAAGVILYELISGSVPFTQRTPIAVMTAHLTEQPPPIECRADGAPVAPALVACTMHALAKSRRERYPDANALLEAILASRSTPGDVESVRPPPPARDSLPFRDTEYDPIPLSAIPTIRPPATSSPSGVPVADGGGVQGWIVVAVVAAAIGIALGVWIALRM